MDNKKLYLLVWKKDVYASAITRRNQFRQVKDKNSERCRLP